MVEASAERRTQHATNQLVFRNTLLLVGAKVLATPIAVVSNAIVARYLGAADYSYIYLASTFTGFGLLFVVFGQTGALPALVSIQRSRAGEFLGTSLVWRLLAGVVVYLILALGCWLVGYELDFQKALALVFAGTLVTAMAGACLETIRGFERTDVDALVNVGTPLTTASITIPVVLLGGTLTSVLTIDILVAVLALVFVSRFIKPVGVGKLVPTRAAARTLFAKGYPFLFFSAALALQPVVDAGFLSRLAPAEVVGWHAAANKLIGLIVFPAAALITALYPVLCRLFVEDRASYAETTRSTLQTSIVLMIPIALGCGLYPEVGVLVFGEENFGPVSDNLRILAVYVFFVYVSMPLGSAVLAADRARGWSLVQAICVIISIVLDPILIPYFQTRSNNGGLGICWSSVASEVFMVLLGLWMLPRGVLKWSMLGPTSKAALSGGAMLGVAWLMRELPWYFSAPVAGLAYLAVLWFTGGLNREQIEFMKSIRSRKQEAAD